MAQDAESRPSSSTSSATSKDLPLFVSHIPPGEDTFYFADIGVGSGMLSVTMKRRYESTSESCHRKAETSCTFQKDLEVIRTMVAFPAWRCGDLVFYKETDFVPEMNDLMVEFFALFGYCCRLATLNLMFCRFYFSRLPTLLGKLRFSKTLILDTCSMYLPEHEQSLAQYFEQNTTLKSCTLVLKSCDLKAADHSSPETILKPLTNGASLKKLVLRITSSKEMDFGEGFTCEKLVCANCHDAIADVVRSNNKFFELELCCSNSRDDGCARVGSASGPDWTYQQCGIPCSAVGLKELDRGLSGPRANTSLTKLNLFPEVTICLGSHFMNELARLLGSNNMLKAVQVQELSDGGSWIYWDSFSATNMESMMWAKLKWMMENELRENTSLNSLVVGYWKLLRIGRRWDVSYGGPCLSTLKRTEDYIVKVKIEP